MHAIHLSDWEGRSQDAPLPRAPLRVGGGGGGCFMLEIPVYLRPFEGEQLYSFFGFVYVVIGFLCICCSQRLWLLAVIAVLSILL